MKAFFIQNFLDFNQLIEPYFDLSLFKAFNINRVKANMGQCRVTMDLKNGQFRAKKIVQVDVEAMHIKVSQIEEN